MASVLGIQVVVLPVAHAEGVASSITCGPDNGRAAYTIRYARRHGLSTASQTPGPLGTGDIAAKIDPANVGDPAIGSASALPEVGIWTFVGTEQNINFTANQVTSGGIYDPQDDHHQCTGQGAPVGLQLQARHPDSYVSCGVGHRVVVWSDGWGSHWVSYRSSANGPMRWVKTMWSNYGDLEMGSLYINEREVYDVVVMAFGDPNKAEVFMPSWYIGCSRSDDPNPQ